ncbi:hypothetical protein EUAN_00880 [Andreesenia angusta]|uniref:RelA/SpoT domain-containing protein n=1 Tax=Andreesenia angusta TaxID=39480 RepID=A0A1S1V9M9_9FIRM|nr:hypothetical protein [Andreesenia angusta]OHW63224.1 hypothetical protein EUAN_00880 [Andreesenia angusta]
MKLEIFDFIEEATGHLCELEDQLEEASDELEKFFEFEMEDFEGFLNINTRVKTKMSLKEKILRNNYYSRYENAEEMIYDLSDLIGIRIECRFIEDENKLYRKLLKVFDVTEDGKYFSTESNPDVKLKLDDKQPQRQKNGFKIFRIDGKYRLGENEITFELQIKSLVNMFWGEIEHKILYKNFNYVMIEDFFRDIMGSIKENLSMIDRQLMILHDHINEMDEDNDEVRKNQFQKLLSKMIHNMYSHKIKGDIGFVVDFRKPCDIIVKYIFEKSKVYDVSSYSITFLGILGRLKDVSQNEISFIEYIEFERYIKFEDEYEKRLGEPILGSLNQDFMWNLLFRILFDIEIGTDTEDFEGFIAFIKDEFLENLKSNGKLNSRFEDWQRNDIVDKVMNAIADVFQENTCIEFVNYDNIERINSKITTRVNRVKNFEDWRDQAFEVVENIKQDIRDILE